MDTDLTRAATDNALDAYNAKTGQTSRLLMSAEDLQDLIADLATDLMHHADRCGFDSAALMARAAEHFEEERTAAQS